MHRKNSLMLHGRGNILRVLHFALEIFMKETLSRRSLRIAARSEMPRWQDRLFIALASAASDATDYFRVPTGRVVEIGAQVAI